MARTGGTAGSWLALVVLFAVYTLNFLDRSLVYILFKPIGTELALSDLELALLGSTAFVLFYTALGVPFGRLADRVHRVRMIAAGLALWSLASSATGWARSFEALLLCRIGVGVGEATLGPAAYSLLADWFPPRLRATAAALFSAGIPLGAGLALGLGGWIADGWGWRAAFPVLGLPGVLLALVVLTLSEPARGAADAAPAPSAPAPSMLSALSSLLRGSKALPWHLAGYAAIAIGSNALSMWVPRYLASHWERSLAEVGLAVGGCAVVGGLCGTLLGGWLADLAQRRFVGGRLCFGALTALGSAACWGLLLGTDDYAVALAAVGVGMALGLAWLGPASADIQDLVPAASRGTAISAYYLVVNVVGYGLAPPAIGALADALGGPETMGTALWLCPLTSGLAALLLALGALTRAREEGAVAVVAARS